MKTIFREKEREREGEGEGEGESVKRQSRTGVNERARDIARLLSLLQRKIFSDRSRPAGQISQTKRKKTHYSVRASSRAERLKSERHVGRGRLIGWLVGRTGGWVGAWAGGWLGGWVGETVNQNVNRRTDRLRPRTRTDGRMPKRS